jgi:hypothetical protein
MNSVREAFEKGFPRPACVEYGKKKDEYFTHYASLSAPKLAREYQWNYEAFKVATASMQEEIDRLQKLNEKLADNLLTESGRNETLKAHNTKLINEVVSLKNRGFHAAGLKENKQLQAEVDALKKDRRDLAEILDRALGKLCGHEPPKD